MNNRQFQYLATEGTQSTSGPHDITSAPINAALGMEGYMGLEPTPSAWKAEMLATNTNIP